MYLESQIIVIRMFYERRECIKPIRSKQPLVNSTHGSFIQIKALGVLMGRLPKFL